jgi:hypothetical protein
VSQGEKGCVLHCHVGCSTRAIVSALGLTERDLFDEQQQHTGAKRTLRATPREPEEPAPMPEPRFEHDASPNRVAEYLYYGAEGEPIARKVRLEPGPGGRKKSFVWEVPAPGSNGAPKWQRARGDGAPRALYHGASAREASAPGIPVHWCEGEKAVDALWAVGVPAVCAPTQKLSPELLAPLAGLDVVVWADRDETGVRFAQRVAHELAGIAASVRVVQSATTGEHDDAFDHITAGHSVDDAVEFRAPSPLDVAFNRQPLVDLLQREKAPPIYPGVPPLGHFGVLVAPPFTGKTSLALWDAIAVTTGATPWSEVREREPGNVLYLSIDAGAEEITRRLASLCETFLGSPSFELVAERFYLIAQDRERVIDPETYRLHDEGLARLEALIRASGATVVYLDAYANLIPLGESENSNETAARIGSALEAIALKTGAAITLLHHKAKPQKDADPSIAFAPRGASALAASARVVHVLEDVQGLPNLRRVRCRSNLGPGPELVTLECAPEGSTSGTLAYFRRAADQVVGLSPSQFLKPGEVVESVSALAETLSVARAPLGGSRNYKELAGRMYNDWIRAGLIARVDSGGRRSQAKRFTLTSTLTGAPHPGVQQEIDDGVEW